MTGDREQEVRRLLRAAPERREGRAGIGARHASSARGPSLLPWLAGVGRKARFLARAEGRTEQAPAALDRARGRSVTVTASLARWRGDGRPHRLPSMYPVNLAPALRWGLSFVSYGPLSTAFLDIQDY